MWAHRFVVFVVFQSQTTSQHFENDIWLHGSKNISVGFYTYLLYNTKYLDIMDGDSQLSGVKDCCLLERLYFPLFPRQNILEKLCWFTILKRLQLSLEKVVKFTPTLIESGQGFPETKVWSKLETSGDWSRCLASLSVWVLFSLIYLSPTRGTRRIFL